MNATSDERWQLGPRLAREVLDPLKSVFIDKDEIIDLLGVTLVGGENLFLLGPPGTAKSALVQELGRRLEGRTFDYLLTRFTEPNELFGPFDLRKLREGELVTNTEGMLPEAAFVFLDELLNANSAILNSLLTVLNERVFRRGRETRELPLLMVVGASNRLPEDDALEALFDRFLLRARCENVAEDRLAEVAEAGWRLDLGLHEPRTAVAVEEIRTLQGMLPEMDFSEVRADYVQMIARLRRAGIAISDRRAVKLQRVVAASAILCGRRAVHVSDFWVLRHIWDREEQQEVIAALVDEKISGAPDDPERHPRSRREGSVDPEQIARDLARLEERLTPEDVSDESRARLRDQLGVLAGRCQWIGDEEDRATLLERVEALWGHFEETG